jgi:hypothetical protein
MGLEIVCTLSNVSGYLNDISIRINTAYRKHVIMVKQFAEEKFSATSLSATNVKGTNTKSKAAKNCNELYSNTPIRFGKLVASV